MRGQFANLPGVQLWYLDSGGTGQPLIFVHANTGTSQSWESQLRFFQPAGYRAIAYDRRGWGNSVPKPDSGKQPGSIAGDLDALLAHLDLGRVHLVAVAGGAFGALDFAAWRPERLRTLVVGASTGNVTDPEIATFIERIQIPAIMRPSPAQYRELSAGFRGSHAEATRRWIDLQSRSRQRDAVTQPVRTPNTYAKLNAIGVPVLVLAGSADLIAPPTLMRLWAAQLRKAEFQTIVGAGHAIAYEEPLAFNAAVRDFLRKHNSPGDLPHPAATGSSTRNGRLRPAAGPVPR